MIRNKNMWQDIIVVVTVTFSFLFFLVMSPPPAQGTKQKPGPWMLICKYTCTYTHRWGLFL